MLFSGVSSACFVAVVALLNSDKAVLSELTEVSRHIHSAGSRFSQWHASSAIAAIGVVPDGPLCPYCSGGVCRVCHDTCFAYEQACGDEGKIASPAISPPMALVAAARKAMSVVGGAIEKVRVAAGAALTNRTAAETLVGTVEDSDFRMGCNSIPGCDFGWTSQPDTAEQQVTNDLARHNPCPPEPPADDDVLTPAPVAPAIANLAADDPFDDLFEQAPTATENQSDAMRPVLYAAASLLAHLSEAADKASEQLYFLAGDQAPQDGD
jgi:hypothetical protein